MMALSWSDLCQPVAAMGDPRLQYSGGRGGWRHRAVPGAALCGVLAVIDVLARTHSGRLLIVPRNHSTALEEHHTAVQQRPLHSRCAVRLWRAL